ncbi:MAG: hypothetical protein AUG80_10920 [Candidatus Rokubacteria bacterium 13_1_20CM_4_68_9]|nr:MAG: hypothetical protein AUG80_10920 [Candidatus Rokubacteria bacterium 13_1_20CM_4_68_9]
MGTSSADALGVLTRGDVTIRGRMPGSSNAIFFVDVACDGVTVQAVYKPERGERPLWDFPPGLFRREVAAYALSEALQWGLVPLTVERDGPYGEGSFQLFVEADFAQHYFTLREDSSHAERLQRICLFDLVANNPASLLADVRRLVEAGMPPSLTTLIDASEQSALLKRARAVSQARRFPRDDSGRRYPWPLI